MSNSTKSRVVRKENPKPFKRTKYRDAKPYLLKDFEERCAYSMQHLRRAGGMKCMEVDHFDPTRKNDLWQDYSNLFLASRHCNNSKWQTWPTASELALGVRFLNCCTETDYGDQIFEDPKTFELVGNTPAAKYQIIVCDLNATHLVNERRDRARIRELLNKGTVIVKAPLQDVSSIMGALQKELNLMIPHIPPPPPVKV